MKWRVAKRLWRALDQIRIPGDREQGWNVAIKSLRMIIAPDLKGPK